MAISHVQPVYFPGPQIGQKLALHNTAAFTVYEVTNTNGQRALRAKERILDTVSKALVLTIDGYVTGRAT